MEQQQSASSRSSQALALSRSHSFSGPLHHQWRYPSSPGGGGDTFHHPHPHSRTCPRSYMPPKKRPATSAQTTVVELEGHQKYILKKGYFENLRCPSCILNNLAQTLKYQGIPWVDWNKNYRGYSDIYEGLTAELEDFFRFIRPTAEDDILRKATFFSISRSLKRHKKVISVKYYGSYSSNTYLPVSDIDIVIFTNKETPIVSFLLDVANLLFQDGIIEKHCSIIPHSRIPLLKFYDCMTGFQINITVNTPNVMERAEYIRKHFPEGSYKLKILYFMKYYLLFKGSNQVYQGGIGSYALSLMVIRYFQERETQDLFRQYEYQGPRGTLLARLLIGFLQRYSDVEFIRSCRISVRGEGDYIIEPPFERYYPTFYKKTSILRIEDHMEPWKNVAAGSFNSDVILSDFGVLLKSLLNPDQCRNDNRLSIIGNALVVVDSFVEFRAILRDIFKYWFLPSPYAVPSNKSRQQLLNERFNNFLLQRNVFGNRNLDFEYKKFDDNTAQLVLKDRKLEPGTATTRAMVTSGLPQQLQRKFPHCRHQRVNANQSLNDSCNEGGGVAGNPCRAHNQSFPGGRFRNPDTSVPVVRQQYPSEPRQIPRTPSEELKKLLNIDSYP